MILRIILIAIFLFMAMYSFVYIRPLPIRMIACVGYMAGIIFVLSPDVTTTIANLFGVGRGLDFFLIFLQVAIVNALIFMIRHINMQHKALTRLSRYIAIRDVVSLKDRND